ncbi:MAG: hypothetical protein M0Q49_02055 [Porticoccaceae bacterium]|nr:hypothetical protein [Porticoccaceae bacterium]
MSPMDRIGTTWGDAAPQWVRLLAEQCALRSQKKVAEEMGYSTTVINQVLGNKYPGDLEAVETAFNGAFLSANVNCPVLGELAAHRCLENQRRKYAATNAIRVRLFKACHGGCPHSRLHREKQS